MSKSSPKIVLYSWHMDRKVYWSWRFRIGRRGVHCRHAFRYRHLAWADAVAIRDAMARAEVIEEK